MVIARLVAPAVTGKTPHLTCPPPPPMPLFASPPEPPPTSRYQNPVTLLGIVYARLVAVNRAARDFIFGGLIMIPPFSVRKGESS
jgi:hypothetical protein